MKLKQKIKQVIKKILGNDYGWSGNYKTWQEAMKRCEGYDASAILDKVKDAALKVKNGEVAYERDSVLFDEVKYSIPLLNLLRDISEEYGNRLHVVDFGGSLGSSYFQNRILFSNLESLKWSVVEQKKFVDAGNELIADEHLAFFNTIRDAIDKRGNHDVLLLSCVLPYLENPYDFLETLSKYRFKYIAIENTYFNYKNANRLTIQKVRPEIYEASYPAWFLDYEQVKDTLASGYAIEKEYLNESYLYLDGKKIQFRGIVFKLK